MRLGTLLSELQRMHHDLCRKHVYSKFVESLRTGDLEQAKSHASFLRLKFNPCYRYEAQDEATLDAIRKAEAILSEAQQRGTDECDR